MNERVILEELHNIVANEPVFPGDTISHRSAGECVERGWATRDADGDFVSTDEGREALERDVSTGDDAPPPGYPTSQYGPEER